MKNVYLNVDQVAERLGVSTDTVWRWRRDSAMPSPVKVGPNTTRWKLSELEEWESTFQTCFACRLPGVFGATYRSW